MDYISPLKAQWNKFIEQIFVIRCGAQKPRSSAIFSWHNGLPSQFPQSTQCTACPTLQCYNGYYPEVCGDTNAGSCKICTNVN